MAKPKVCILRAAGTNCDAETAYAFRKAGAVTESVHVNRLIGRERRLRDYQVLAIPGGFTYGDDIAAGKVLANELKYKLSGDIGEFIRQGKLIIGICNGFQILVKSGLLPGSRDLSQQASLILNDSAKFEDRWVYLKVFESAPQRCVWTKGLERVMYLPVACGEGKFVAASSLLTRLKLNKQVVFQYCDENGRSRGYPYNPSGSQEDIAGICDESGRILGLMPHPERHVSFLQHPRWMRGRGRQGQGLAIFSNGIEYAKKNL